MADTLPESPGAATPRSATNELKATAERATAAAARGPRGHRPRNGARPGRGDRPDRGRQAGPRPRDVRHRRGARRGRAGSGGSSVPARAAQREASKGLASVSRALQGRSVGELVAEAAAFGRRNPVAFLGGATLAGFALARLAMASAPATGSAPRDEDERPQTRAGPDAPHGAGAWPQTQPEAQARDIRGHSAARANRTRQHASVRKGDQR